MICSLIDAGVLFCVVCVCVCVCVSAMRVPCQFKKKKVLNNTNRDDYASILCITREPDKPASFTLRLSLS